MAETSTSKQETVDPQSRLMVESTIAIAAGGSLLILSCMSLSGTFIALALAAPLFVIFSPILIPAAIAAGILCTGFFATFGFVIAAASVFSWIYRYATGDTPVGSEVWRKVASVLAQCPMFTVTYYLWKRACTANTSAQVST